MYKNVSILVPFKSDNGPRANNFNWIKKFYREMMTGVEICIGESRTTLFSRSQAINHAAKQATNDIFVISDADVIYDPSIIKKSIEILDDHTWVIPYNKVFYLAKERTNKILLSEPSWPVRHRNQGRLIQASKGRPCVGGLNVVSRKQFEYIGGFDERFIGWGYEDNAFATAMNTLCGPYKRLNHKLYHLWHPIKRNGNNNERYGKYNEVDGNIEKMKKIIKNRYS
ncbi:galactosyltransferase-related protein [Salipaludibacillus sp. HK11]|uniref:galactosyltransferase-related protein n=1 Tax=Salipaludibacillus sp. HK11 TaxID=3394320 RepID=UPI0039FD9022